MVVKLKIGFECGACFLRQASEAIDLATDDYNLKIVGIECDKKACSLALSSIKENNLEEKITIINDYVQNVRDYFEINSVDIVGILMFRKKLKEIG